MGNNSHVYFLSTTGQGFMQVGIIRPPALTAAV